MRVLAFAIGISFLIASCGEIKESQSEEKGIRGHRSGTDYTEKTNKPYVKPSTEALSEANVSGPAKKPLLFYYAIDTEEPYMQMATDYDVRGLRASCNEKLKTNWIAFVNSHYVHANKLFMLCRDGKVSYQRLEGLDQVVQTISDPEFDNSNPEAPLYIKLGHKKKFNKYFAQYPFAHPDVLAGILKFTAARLFPPDQYKYFLNLRSHGGSKLLLSGLTDELLEKKNKVQKPVVEKFNAAIEKVQFKNSLLGQRVSCEATGGFFINESCYCIEGRNNSETGTCERVLGYAGFGNSVPGELGYSFIGLGSAKATKSHGKVFESMGWVGEGMGWLGEGMGWVGEGMGYMGEGMGYMGEGMGYMGEGMGYMGEGMGWFGEGMGWYGEGMGWYGEGMGYMGEGLGYFGEGLGWVGEGLGLSEAGLGIDSGLSTKNFYGTDHEAMGQVFRMAAAAGIEFGFVFFESCNSNVKKNKTLATVLESELDNVDAYYSAEGTIWYRNLDLHALLFWTHVAKGDKSANLTKLMSVWSEEIPVMVESN